MKCAVLKSGTMEKVPWFNYLCLLGLAIANKSYIAILQSTGMSNSQQTAATAAELSDILVIPKQDELQELLSLGAGSGSAYAPTTLFTKATFIANVEGQHFHALWRHKLLSIGDPLTPQDLEQLRTVKLSDKLETAMTDLFKSPSLLVASREHLDQIMEDFYAHHFLKLILFFNETYKPPMELLRLRYERDRCITTDVETKIRRMRVIHDEMKNAFGVLRQ